MIRIDRVEIDLMKRALKSAMSTPRNYDRMALKAPTMKDDVLERCVMVALQLAVMEAFGINEVCVPSDVSHYSLSGFGTAEESYRGPKTP